MTADGQLKRLFPIRFRHLKGDSAFRRWDWVDFKYRRPTSDRRKESCHVYEDSIQVYGSLPARERSPLLNKLVSSSAKEAEARGQSLALIRPQNTEFYYRTKRPGEVEAERHAYAEAAGRQGSFFDAQLKALEPSPYEFRFRFEDGAGRHDYSNGDWEAHAMFFHGVKREGSDSAALKWMQKTFNDDYPRRGMLFCIGNMAKRPQTWQLLGVLRVDEPDQLDLF